MSTQDMNGGKSFPTKLSPVSDGQAGDELINTNAPYGNKKFVPAGKFVQNQGHNGTQLSQPAIHESTTRDIRVADLGPGFGNGPLEGGVEIAGKMQTIPKKFLPGGRTF